MPTKQHALERQAFNRRAQWDMLRALREARDAKSFNAQARADLRRRAWASVVAQWYADAVLEIRKRASEH